MPDFTHFVFVDFENVQDVDLTLAKDKPVHVTLLIGAKQTKIPTKLATQFHTFGPQLSLIEVGGSGRNALDLTLAMYLGREIERQPKVNFVIVSRDQDFDPMITHLKITGARIERVSKFAEVSAFVSPRKSPRPVRTPRPSAAKPAAGPATRQPMAPPASAARPKPTDTALPPRISMDTIPDLARRQKDISARLSNPTNKNRPTTQKALLAHLRTTLGKNATEVNVDATIAQLTAQRVLSIDAQQRIVYPPR